MGAGHLQPNINAANYHLDAYDGMINLSPLPLVEFWRFAINKKIVDKSAQPTFSVDPKYFSWEDLTLDIESHIDIDMLGWGNVEFILSHLPLAPSDKIEPVYIPVHHNYQMRQITRKDKIDYYIWRLGAIIRPEPTYIYKVKKSIPRAFAAKSVYKLTDAKDSNFLVDTIKNNANSHVAIVSEADANNLEPHDSLQIESVTKITNGYNVEISSPEGGIVVVNQYYMPFWSAWVDGKPANIVVTNMVHMAIQVQPGARNVVFKYKRPTLKETLLDNSNVYK